MFDLIKAKAVAVGAMVGFGLAAPLAAWQLGPPQERLDAALHSGIDANAMRIVSPDIDLPVAISLDELVVLGPQHQMLAEMVVTAEPMAALGAQLETQPEAQPERRCYWHQSETLATGAVLVCDVERTPSGRTGSVFTPSEKPTELAPRDVPSPSGLLR